MPNATSDKPARRRGGAHAADTSKPAVSAVDMFAFEKEFLNHGCHIIAGVDEAGRGPLAGPVAVAAVILPSDGSFDLPVNDSKALTAHQRDTLYEALTHSPAIRWSVVLKSAEEIDRINILRATHAGMREAVLNLGNDVEVALVDGLSVSDFPVPAKFIVKGDARSASIAAASIIAKVTRDRYMSELDAQYPGYGFAKHKGYGTAEHLNALQALGPCPEHRRSFAPVAQILEGPRQLSLHLT